MMENFVALVASFATAGMMDYVFYPVMLVYFVASVPGLIRWACKWR